MKKDGRFAPPASGAAQRRKSARADDTFSCRARSRASVQCGPKLGDHTRIGAHQATEKQHAEVIAALHRYESDLPATPKSRAACRARPRNTQTELIAFRALISCKCRRSEVGARVLLAPQAP